MRELDRVFGRRWGVVLVGLLAGACVGGGGGGGDADGGKADQSCEDGEEGCACYGNGTCDKGLSCLSRLCVNTEGDNDDDEIEADASRAPAAEPDAEADDAPSNPSKDDANDDTASSDDANDDQDDGAPTDEPTDDAKPEPSDDESSEPATDDDEPVATSDEPDDDGPSDASVDETTSEPTSDDTGMDEPVSDDTETSDATTDDDTDPPPPPPMGELIVNGDFQDGIAGWNIETTTTATPDTTTGDLCLRPLVEYDYVYGPVGWPLDPLDGFALESGATYEFSFDAYITSADGSVVEFEAKVGEAETPYTPVFTWTPSVSPEPTRFAAQFVSDYSFEHAGIVFTIYTTIDVCIGNVSMTRVD